MTQIEVTQISIVDYLTAYKEFMQTSWADWRDAQGLDDAAKQLVDDAYGEYMRTLDILISTMVPF